MCENPLTIHRRNEPDTTVKCRKCEQCKAERLRHWTGRVNAEMQTAYSVSFVTLTYGGGYDNPEAYTLNYEHVKLFFKKLRKAGHRFSYINVGEFGTDKGRAHWHVLFFWYSSEPEWEYDKMLQPPEQAETGDPLQFDWPFGHIKVERPRSKQATAHYIMKYMQKDGVAENLRYSKKPALGERYLLEYARDHARRGLALWPQHPTYTIPENLNAQGKPFWYRVDPHSSLHEKMIIAYLEEWEICRPKQKRPKSDVVDEWLWDAAQDCIDLNTELRAQAKKQFGTVPCHVTDVDLAHGYHIQKGNIIYIQEGEIIWHEHLHGKGLLHALAVKRRHRAERQRDWDLKRANSLNREPVQAYR